MQHSCPVPRCSASATARSFTVATITVRHHLHLSTRARCYCPVPSMIQPTFAIRSPNGFSMKSKRPYPRGTTRTLAASMDSSQLGLTSRSPTGVDRSPNAVNPTRCTMKLHALSKAPSASVVGPWDGKPTTQRRMPHQGNDMVNACTPALMQRRQPPELIDGCPHNPDTVTRGRGSIGFSKEGGLTTQGRCAWSFTAVKASRGRVLVATVLDPGIINLSE